MDLSWCWSITNHLLKWLWLHRCLADTKVHSPKYFEDDGLVVGASHKVRQLDGFELYLRVVEVQQYLFTLL